MNTKGSGTYIEREHLKLLVDYLRSIGIYRWAFMAEFGCRVALRVGDLSDPILVTSYSRKVLTHDEYSKDVAYFIVWWMNNVWEDLNGFYGMGEFVLVDFEIK